ncbi:MAG: DivIVA domain-containing protein [Acidimicrobiia bacterium]
MALSPFDVEHKTFRTSLRGYTEEEVDEFLDEVVASLREYEQRLREASEQVGVLESELEASREAETAIRRTFIAAQRTADQMIEEAQVEAKKILADARSEAVENEADRIRVREETQAEIDGMRQAVTDLKELMQKLVDDVFAEAEVIEGSITEVAATHDLDREFDIPALVAEEGEDDIEYYDDGLEISEEDEAPDVSEAADLTDEEVTEEPDDVQVDLDDEPEPAAHRSRPRRPWERDTSDD